MIDVGGPSMLRAAAKNFAHVTVVSDSAQYEIVLSELREHGDTTGETRKRLAREAFATTAAYDVDDRELVRRDRAVPPTADDRAAQGRRSLLRREPAPGGGVLPRSSARGGTCSREVEQLGGKELSYNNLADLEGARRVAREFTLPAAVIVKHANPVRRRGGDDDRGGVGARARRRSGLGVRLRRRAEPAGRRRARRADRRALRRGAARARPTTTRRSQSLRAKTALRILADRERRAETPGERDYKRVLGGLLVQDRDDGRRGPRDDAGRHRRGRARSSGATSSSPGASASTSRRMRSCSCATCQTIGIGAGQMSRVDAVRIAVEKAREHGHDTAGASLASDAFFPFADGPQIALDAGISARHPAGRLEARRRGRRRRRGGGRGYGPHRPAAFPPLTG